MGDINLSEEYLARREAYEKLGTEVKYILEEKIKSEGIAYHEITSRVKEFDSFRRKVESKESKSPFEDITDICGVRVICLFLSDVEKISETIETNFKIESKDDRIYSEPDAFGYLSVHYVGSLPDTFVGPRYDRLKDLKFEIQLRTIAMHAWATISHYLDYKTPLAIPSQLRKDFNALSAMFYVADTHFEMFFGLSEKTRKDAQDSASELGSREEEINLDTLKAYLERKYPERSRAEADSLSQLIEELARAGYVTTAQLDEALLKSEKAFEAYERDTRKAMSRFLDIGVVRVSLEILDEKFREVFGTSAALIDTFEKYREMLK